MQQVREYTVALGTNSIPLPVAARVVGVTTNTSGRIRIVVLHDTEITTLRHRSIAVQLNADAVDHDAEYIGTATATGVGSTGGTTYHVFELRSA